MTRLRAELLGGREQDLGAPLDLLEVDPLDDGVRALPSGTEDDARNAGAGENGRVGPERNAERRRFSPEHRFRPGAQQPDDRLLLRDLERLAREEQAQLCLDGWIGAASSRDDAFDLRFDELGRLAGDGPPLPLEETPLRLARELLPALDERGMERAAREQRMGGRRAKRPVALLEPDEEAAHLRDCVDSEVGA